MIDIRLIIGAVILVFIGLLAWGVKHAIDTFQEMSAQNAALKIQNTELATSLRETERTSGIVFQTALYNGETKRAITAVTGTIQSELRALAASDPALRDRASRAVPLAVQQRLRKRSTDTDGYPAVQGTGPVPSGDAGTGSAERNGRLEGRDTRVTPRSPAGVQR